MFDYVQTNGFIPTKQLCDNLQRMLTLGICDVSRRRAAVPALYTLALY